MSLHIVQKKFESLDEKEKILRMTYDVQGSNKYQHRFIQDLKEDFKETFSLKYSTKTYGALDPDRDPAALDLPEQTSPIRNSNSKPDFDDFQDFNFKGLDQSKKIRPVSGKKVNFPANTRPFSSTGVRPVTASTIRPVTASSNKEKGESFSKLMGPSRPISANPGMIGTNYSQPKNISEFLSPKGSEFVTIEEKPDQSYMRNSKMRLNETLFWKNTKKFDIAQSKSQKTYETKPLVFTIPHTNPNLITAGDLDYLKQDNLAKRIETSKLSMPDNHDFATLAKKAPTLEKTSSYDPKKAIGEAVQFLSDLKQQTKATVSSTTNARPPRPQTSKLLELQIQPAHSPNVQRPSTAHVMQSTPKTINYETYIMHFSGMSESRKVNFFVDLAKMIASIGSDRTHDKLPSIDWDTMLNFTPTDDTLLFMLIIDLNNFNHIRYRLTKENGKLMVVVGKDTRDIITVYNDFQKNTKTNILYLTIYSESSQENFKDLFSRIIINEKPEKSYEVSVWKQIYNFYLHVIVLSTAYLFPECQTYGDLQRIIVDIIEDNNNYILKIADKIFEMKKQQIIVERNGQVYNFDFHSYVVEFSSFYTKSLETIKTNEDQGKKVKTKDDRQRIKSAKVQRHPEEEKMKNSFEGWARSMNDSKELQGKFYSNNPGLLSNNLSPKDYGVSLEDYQKRSFDFMSRTHGGFAGFSSGEFNLNPPPIKSEDMDGMYYPDPNGIIVHYKKPRMKKKTNITSPKNNKRPSSAQVTTSATASKKFALSGKNFNNLFLS